MSEYRRWMSLNFFELKCPKCNAALTVQEGLQEYRCEYCGALFSLTGLNSEVIKANAQVRLLEEENRQKRFELEHSAKEDRVQAKRMGKAVAIYLLIIFLLGLVISIGQSCTSHREEQVSKLYAEIQVEIAQGNYDSALKKAKRLYGTSSMSDREKKKWDREREKLIKKIEKLMG